MHAKAETSLEQVTLGGGCFWCLEPVFEELIGVESVVVGYAGGQHPHPDYQLVCSGTTGHAEVVQIGFNPDEISYADLLQVFFSVHDPTTLNRQGADAGTQYRSIILYEDEQQQESAETLISTLNAQEIWTDPIVTEIEPLTQFHPAEDYHQGYYRKNPDQGYCRLVVAPKLGHFRQEFSQRLKPG
jgi:peptide-methionine (S)-S-oxide reductase